MTKKKKTSTTNLTKAELEENIKDLKELLKNAKKEIKLLSDKSLSEKLKAEELPEEAIGIINVAGHYKKVIVAFDPVSLQSSVKSISNYDVRSKDLAMARFRLEELATKMILDFSTTKKGDYDESVKDFGNA